MPGEGLMTLYLEAMRVPIKNDIIAIMNTMSHNRNDENPTPEDYNRYIIEFAEAMANAITDNVKTAVDAFVRSGRVMTVVNVPAATGVGMIL